MGTGGGIFQLIDPDPDGRKCRSMINELTIAPDGEITRGCCKLNHADGSAQDFNIAFVVASRTAIGEAEEVLLFATPSEDYC